METVHTILEAEPSLPFPCCVCSGINPRVKSGRFMKILPDYEHMEYRDVYTCRTYLLLALAFVGEHGREAAWRGTSNSGHKDCLGVTSKLPSLAFAVFLPWLFSVAQPQQRPHLSRGPGLAADVGRDSTAALGFLGSTSKTTPVMHILVFTVC